MEMADGSVSFHTLLSVDPRTCSPDFTSGQTSALCLSQHRGNVTSCHQELPQ